MTEVSTTTVALPTDLVRELDVQAKRMGLAMPVYLALLSRVGNRHHDAEFLSAVRYAFTKYPNALRKLAK